MNNGENYFKNIIVLFPILLFLSATMVTFGSTTWLADAEELGQIKIQEGFEIWPPAGWSLIGPASIVQTSGTPGGECQGGHHAAKIYFQEYHRPFGQLWSMLFHEKKINSILRTKMMTIGHRFFGEMGTPTFNGKKGGGNILTFWHKQSINQSPDQLTVFVTNGLGSLVQVASYPSSMNWTFETINLNDFIRPTKMMTVWFLAILHDESNVYLDEVTITGVSGE